VLIIRISVTWIDRGIPDYYREISDHTPVIARFAYHGGAPDTGDGEDEPEVAVSVPSGARRILITRDA